MAWTQPKTWASEPLTSSDVVNEVFTYTIEDGNEDAGNPQEEGNASSALLALPSSPAFPGFVQPADAVAVL